jgi:hypothetical protein
VFRHSTVRLWLAAVTAALAWPAGAGAASVAYVDNGEVWVSSLDGSQKARLAAPVINNQGMAERWLDVAQSDGGRIVAVRNEPGKSSRFSWFQIWEPDGTSTVQGPLNAPDGWAVYVYPLGFDITADGAHLVYGFSNDSECCPPSSSQGTYVRPATSSALDPVAIPGQEHPSTVGQRIIGSSGTTVSVQDGTSPYGPDFTPWLDTSGTALDLGGADVAATGTLAAYEVEQWTGENQTIGRIGLLSTSGVDEPVPFPATVDCVVPAAGVANEVSLSPDATRIAWTDDQGLNVAGTPTTAADPCELSAAPVLISATGRHGSIGGGSVAPFLPQAAATPDPGTTPPGNTPPGNTPGTVAAPELSLPARPKAKALASSKGLRLTVRVYAAGPVSVTATVPAARLGRRGKPVVIARGNATAAAAGKVVVELRVKRALRRKVRRLGGTRVKLRVLHGGHTIERSVRLR